MGGGCGRAERKRSEGGPTPKGAGRRPQGVGEAPPAARRDGTPRPLPAEGGPVGAA